MLAAVGVSKAYGAVHALSDVSLHARRGEIVGLVGPNGAGKTTLVDVLSGRTSPDRGSVIVDGVDALRDRRALRRRVAVAAQEVGIYPTRRVIDNLRHFARLAGLHGTALRTRVDDTARGLHLTALARRRAGDTSGGEQRRLHVAIALLPRAPVLFLDEPTANVDVDSRADILDLVAGLAAQGVTVCYATHYLHEIEALDAQVVMIDGGRVIATGSVRDLVGRYGTTVLEVTLTEPLPHALRVPGCRVVADGLTLRISSDDTAPPAMPAVLAALAGYAGIVRSVEVRRPSLDLVYLRLRQSASDSGPPAEDAGAAPGEPVAADGWRRW